MMISPNCPDHGRLALDLALGRLDDDAAARADEAVESCAVCSEWWKVQFEGELVAVVDEAVEAVFDELQLPTRRRRHGWMAAAAAVVMTFGAATLWLARDPQPVRPAPIDVALIQSIDFENFELQPVKVSTSADLEMEVVEETPAFVPETVRAEEIRVADAAEVATDETPLFTGSFESGSLAGWGVPST